MYHHDESATGTDSAHNNAVLRRKYLCVKLSLMVSNLVFLVFGLILLGVGSYALNHSLISGQTLPAGLITMGVFIVLLSIVGGISAWRESRIGLAVFLSFLLLISVILFGVSIAVYTHRANAAQYLAAGYIYANNDLRVNIQNQLSCCGLYNYSDAYAGAPCPISTNSTTSPYFHSTCLPLMVTSFTAAYTSAGGSGIAFSVLMLCDIVFVCCLLHGIRIKIKQQGLDAIRNYRRDDIELDSISEQQQQQQQEQDTPSNYN